MKKSKVPFDKEKFYDLIEKEDWVELWRFLEEETGNNITEEDLRIAFNVMPKKYCFWNLRNWGNRFSVDFLREFNNRFTYRVLDCARPKQKSARLIEEFQQYFSVDDSWLAHCDEEMTDALKYPHDLKYIKKYIHKFNFARIFNLFGNREKFNLPQEEIDYLKEHAKVNGWGVMT